MRACAQSSTIIYLILTFQRRERLSPMHKMIIIRNTVKSKRSIKDFRRIRNFFDLRAVWVKNPR